MQTRASNFSDSSPHRAEPSSAEGVKGAYGMHTGDICERSGVYRSACCNRDMAMAKGASFPPCVSCGHEAVYIFVRPFGRATD